MGWESPTNWPFSTGVTKEREEKLNALTNESQVHGALTSLPKTPPWRPHSLLFRLCQCRPRLPCLVCSPACRRSNSKIHSCVYFQASRGSTGLLFYPQRASARRLQRWVLAAASGTREGRLALPLYDGHNNSRWRRFGETR